MTIEENTVIGIGITAGVGIAGIGITVGVMIAIEGIIIGIDTTTGIAITATAVMPVIMTVISAPPSESIDDGFGDGVAFGRH